MLSLLRIITVLSGLGLFLIGVIWWLQPAAAAEMLGASLLDGTGRSTQIGDSGAFFIGAGGLLALGAIRNHAAPGDIGRFVGGSGHSRSRFIRHHPWRCLDA